MGRPLRPVSRIPWKLYGSGKNIQVAHTFQLSTPTGISSFFPVFSPMSTAAAGERVRGGRGRERYYNHCKLPKESSYVRRIANTSIARFADTSAGNNIIANSSNLLLPSRYENLESLQFFLREFASPLAWKFQRYDVMASSDVMDGVCRFSSVIFTLVNGTSFDPLRIRQQFGTSIFGDFVKL